MAKKDYIYYGIGLIIAVGLGILFNSIGNIQLDIGILISWILAITMLIIMGGITVCSFLLAKPLSKKIEL